MIPFQLDILDTKTGETHRVSPSAGWNDCAADFFCNRTCDCFLAGYFEMGYVRDGVWMFHHQPHEGKAHDRRRIHGCDHKAPSRRFKVLRSILGNGISVELDKLAA
jgi:hypothetical protein